MDSQVDASVAITRTNQKQTTNSMPAPARPPAASVRSAGSSREVSGMPGGLSGMYLKAAVTLFETQLGSHVFQACKARQPGIRSMLVSKAGPLLALPVSQIKSSVQQGGRPQLSLNLILCRICCQRATQRSQCKYYTCWPRELARLHVWVFSMG